MPTLNMVMTFDARARCDKIIVSHSIEPVEYWILHASLECDEKLRWRTQYCVYPCMLVLFVACRVCVCSVYVESANAITSRNKFEPISERLKMFSFLTCSTTDFLLCGG